MSLTIDSSLYAALKALFNSHNFPGAYGGVDPRRPIPNSVVKRTCGEDTEGATPWKISSVPG